MAAGRASVGGPVSYRHVPSFGFPAPRGHRGAASWDDPEAPAPSPLWPEPCEDELSAPSLPVPADVVDLLAQAYDEDAEAAEESSDGLSGFRWTGVLDAAQAAWIGGTKLLSYGELLPGGLERALTLLSPGGLEDARDGSRQLALELGMGRGRAALQLFLGGATVIGVELASERFGLAVAALERLAHRSPEIFEISKRMPEAVRIRRRNGPKGSICEVRLGSFFDVVSEEELAAATLVFLQVCVPQPAWPRLRELVGRTASGCRLLTYEDLGGTWEGGEAFPCVKLGSPRLACTWAPEEGHAFHCYERTDEVRPAPSSWATTPSSRAALAGSAPGRER